MNLEGLALAVIKKETAPLLLGGRIEKIYQGEHSLCLHVKKEAAVLYLAADLGQGGPCLFLQESPGENPSMPPAFCMLLRKHLEEARIIGLKQEGLERCLILEAAYLGAAGKLCTKELIFELTGRNSNIILTEEGRIIDCLRHIGPGQNSYRQLLPGLPYLPPPPQAGLAIDSASPAAIVAKMRELTFARGALAALVSATCGIGRATAAELLLRANIEPQAKNLNEEQEAALGAAIANLQEAAAAAASPVYAHIGKDGRLKTLLLLEPLQITAGEKAKAFPSALAALRFAAALTPLAPPRKTELLNLVTNESQRLRRKLQALAADFEEAGCAERQRQLADTLMANLYSLPKGATQVTLNNIYDGEPTLIPLSPKLSGNGNAQAYYKRYNKYKTARTEVQKQMRETKDRLTYLDSVAQTLDTADTREEAEEIAAELQEAGLLRPKRGGTGKKNKQAASQPYRFSCGPDCFIYVGKNNKQNDLVTFTIGSPKDLWFHTKNIPGSHVLLKSFGPRPGPEAIAAAAELAAYFSKARQGSQVPVDCTLRRYVKKPAGAPPGFVIFTEQTTYYVTPDEAKIKAKYGLK